MNKLLFLTLSIQAFCMSLGAMESGSNPCFPKTLKLAVTSINASSSGGTDGEISAQVEGGTPPYRYSLNGASFQTSPTFTNLPAGSYVLEVQDIQGCTDSTTAAVMQPLSESSEMSN